VLNQYLGEYETREPLLVKYLEKIKEISSEFDSLNVHRAPWPENAQANALSKLASTTVLGASRTVLVKELAAPSIDRVSKTTINEVEAGTNLMTPIINYKTCGQLPPDRMEARRVAT